MRSLTLLLTLTGLLTICQSCSPPCPEDPVCEKYIHRYGVPLPQEDWVSRGQDGQVVSTLKTGVVATRNYNGGVLEGQSTYTFPHNSAIATSEMYSNGTLMHITQNYPSGLPMEQTIQQTDTDKMVLRWYENGAPQSKEFYKDDCLNQGEYYLVTGQTEASVDSCQGVRIKRDQFGQMLSKDTIANGKMVSQTTFYPNGSPKAVSQFSSDGINQQISTFFPGGEPSTIEVWNGGQQHGTTLAFHNGEKCAEIPYVKGIKHGIERRFINNDVLVEEITWKNGQKEGPAHTYVEGEAKTRWYFQGREVTQSGYEVLTRPYP